MQMKINNKFKISGSLLSKLYTEVTDNPYQGILLSDLLVDHLTLVPVALQQTESQPFEITTRLTYYFSFQLRFKDWNITV